MIILHDTDQPKTGRHIEKIGRLFSYVVQKHTGFKALTKAWSDGKDCPVPGAEPFV